MADPIEGIDAHWEGVMITYTEQDFPTSKPYERTIPGWKCRQCGRTYGTAGLPPRECGCGHIWTDTPKGGR